MELKDIKGLGAKSLDALALEQVNTVDELVYNFPISYDIYELNQERAFSSEMVCISVICDTKPALIKYRNNVYSIIFYVLCGNYRFKCIFFSSDYVRYKLFKGTSCVLYGKYKMEEKEFYVRNIFFDSFENKVNVNYSYKNLKSYQIQKAIQYVLDSGYQAVETLPLEIRKKYKLCDMNTFIQYSHLPKNKEEVHQLERRRKYEEFFWYAMSFKLLKSMRGRSNKSFRMIDYKRLNQFVDSIGFPLTEGQWDAIKDCMRDIVSDHPMNRLVQGDVGCGKSIVAVYCALALISAGYQACVMVPTELLANQQYLVFKKYFEVYGISVELLTSSIKKREKNQILENVKNGSTQMLIGTHALLEDSVVFKRLGIAIIDEQHKFGVNQRKRLIEKYPELDALYLTATPIPRTLGLTVFGDLDITSIKSMPKGRIPVNTKIVDFNKINGLLKFILKEIENGGQIYAVVPLVVESEGYDVIHIDEAFRIFTEALPNISIEAVHGKMAADKKNAIMERFHSGETKVLISTTVIEVGVNVPNASVMVILDADRFGLSQIHQLRGRVGRGSRPSYCALVTRKPNTERLKALEVISDGFGIADEDFKERGPGNYFGSEQSGFSSFQYVDFETDFRIWECAKKDVEEYYPLFSNGTLQSIRFTEIILENVKNGFKSN